MSMRPVSLVVLLALLASMFATFPVSPMSLEVSHAGHTTFASTASEPATVASSPGVGAAVLQAAITSPLSPTNAIELSRIGRYDSGVEDESAVEIAAYDPASQRLFVTSAFSNTVDVLDLSDPSNPTRITTLTDLGGSPNSVATANGVVAVAVEANPIQDDGEVVFYDTDGTRTGAVTVGALPDMLTFSPDGSRIIVANEGEPNGDYTNDPPGAVSVIDISDGVASATVTTLDFSAFNTDGDRYSEIANQAIRVFGPGSSIAQDLEPEYIALAGNNAYVTLQENNALAIVDIASSPPSVTGIVALGFKNHNLSSSNKSASLFTYPFTDLPPLGTTAAGEQILLGGFSGLYFEGEVDGKYRFVTHPDRGPNAEPINGQRPFPLPDFQTRIIRFDFDPTTGAIEIVDTILLSRDGGATPITGLPNLAGTPGLAYADEIPVDLSGNTLEYDPFGADLEGIVIAPDDTFWMVDEYRPAIYHFSATGELIERYVPEGSSDTVNTGTAVLPAVYAQRWTNRGFEAVALEGNKLYAFIQSPLDNPDVENDANAKASIVNRILEFDITTEQPTAEYVYLIEGGPSDKIGDAVALGGGEFLVVERDSATGPGALKKIFKIDLAGATDTLGSDVVLESLDAAGLAAEGITPVSKEAYVDLAAAGYYQGDKVEGLALLPDGSLAVINDNDFGVGGSTFDPETGLLDPPPARLEPILGIIKFGSNALDPSNDDDGINIANWPVRGMYQPDAIDSFEIGGTTYLITANEGDAREYENGLVEESDVADLILDSTAFPNAADLRQDAALGNLKVTRANRLISDPAQVRVVHASPDAPAVDILINGSVELASISFKDVSDYLELSAGSYTVSVNLAGTDAEVLSQEVTVDGGKAYTIAAIGLVADASLSAAVFADNLAAPLNDKANVRVYHVAPPVGGVDVVSSDGIVTNTLISNLGFGEASSLDTVAPDTFDTLATGYLSLDEATYDLFVTPATLSSTVAISLENTTLTAGNIYSVFAISDTTSLTATVVATPATERRLWPYGARSFSIWSSDGSLVYGSGDQFEQITAAQVPTLFNADSGDPQKFDQRSDNKGPEPEGVVIGEIDGRTYAFIGLERTGGVMVYDVTTPAAPQFVSYLDPVSGAPDDVSPEGLVFIPADESPNGKPLLVVSFEFSGTVSVFEISGSTRLSLLHNNDGESGLLPTTQSVDDGELAVGGAAAFKTVVEREIADATAQGNASVMVYAGDAFLASATIQCSFPITDSSKPLYDAVAQRQMPYDAHILGNHEFDYTPDFLERFIREFEGKQPFLSANLDFSGEPGFDDLVDEDGLILTMPEDGRVIGKSMIVTDAATGKQFGIIGATTPFLASISSPRDVTVLPDVAAVVQGEIDRLQSLGINRIIFVSHLQDSENDIELIEQLNGVDVAVAGGGDEFLINPDVPQEQQLIPGTNPADIEGTYPLTVTDAGGRTVYLVTSVDRYRYLGRLDVEFDITGEVSRVISEESYPRRVVIESDLSSALGVSDAVTPDANIVNTVNEPVEDCLADLAATRVATTEILLDVSRNGVRGGENNTGNLVADSFIFAYDKYVGTTSGLSARGPDNPVVALQNGGGIRQNAGDVLPRNGVVPGPITRLDTIDVLPFDNFISVVEEVSPADLLALLDGITTEGIYHVANLELTYTTGTDEEGDTRYFIDDIILINTDGTKQKLVNNGDVVPGASDVSIVTNSFVAMQDLGANPNQTALVDSNNARLFYEQPLREYLEDLGTIEADDPRYQPGGEGRILIARNLDPIDIETGGTVTSPDGILTITVPPGVISGTGQITFTYRAQAPDRPKSLEGVGAGVIGFEVRAFTATGEITRFNKLIDITATYAPELLSTDALTVEESLRVFFYNETTDAWEDPTAYPPCIIEGCQQSVDTAANSITLTVDHLTEYAVVESEETPQQETNVVFLPVVRRN